MRLSRLTNPELTRRPSLCLQITGRSPSRKFTRGRTRCMAFRPRALLNAYASHEFFWGCNSPILVQFKIFMNFKSLALHLQNLKQILQIRVRHVGPTLETTGPVLQWTGQLGLLADVPLFTSLLSPPCTKVRAR